MSDQDSRYEDLERTDVLPQLTLQAEPATDLEAGQPLPKAGPQTGPKTGPQTSSQPVAVPFGTAAQPESGNGRISTLPAKPTTTELALGGIRGKLSDLEHRLGESQDRQIALKQHCEQLGLRHQVAEERAHKAEANYLQQSADLHRITQAAAEAQQRLDEERVRFQAQAVEAERQLVDARTRNDKRVASLEQLLNEQTSRAAQSERTAAEARLELEKVRGEIGVTKAAIRSLEGRLSEQTNAAAEITRLYSLQTSEVAAGSDAMVVLEKRLADAQQDKELCDERIVGLEAAVRSANDSVSALQADIALKLRHISALESGLENRDRSLDQIKTKLATDGNWAAELTAAKESLEQRCTELENAVTAANAVSANAEQEIARLNTALRGNDVRINDLASALRAAERTLQERDAALAEITAKAAATASDHAQAVERTDELWQRLGTQEAQIEDLQGQLTRKTAELASALHSATHSLTQQTEMAQSVIKLESQLLETRETMERIMAERNQLEIENHTGRAELSRLQDRYEEAVQTIVAARGSIADREQKIESLEREVRAATQRLEDAHARVERAAAVAEGVGAELRRRDGRIALLEQKCAEHATALQAINQDIERVNTANPSERLAAMGYVLESLDQSGTTHRIGRTTTTVGRAASNDISIDSTSVSRYHARIVVQPEGVWLIDLQSTNGCAVNGRRVSRQILCDGDAIMVGHCKFRFSMLGASKEVRVQDDAFPLIDEPLFVTSTQAVNRDAPREQRH